MFIGVEGIIRFLVKIAKKNPKFLKAGSYLLDSLRIVEEAFPSSRSIEYAFILRKICSMQKGKVLDVGCADIGNCLPAILASLGWEVWGIDINEFKFRHKNFHFLKQDIREATFPDGFFDCIYAVSTMEHIGLKGRYDVAEEDLDGDLRAVENILRIIKPDGLLLVTIPCGKSFVILRPFQRVYDKARLSKLFSKWIFEEQIYYRRDDNGYWLPISEQVAFNLDPQKGDIAIALLELSPSIT